MSRGRPPKCIHCGKALSIQKGLRRTKTLGVRRIRLCKNCGRKFTPRNQKLANEENSESQANASSLSASRTTDG